MAGGLQGIVTEVRAILQDPAAISKIKESDLCLLTYGQLKYAYSVRDASISFCIDRFQFSFWTICTFFVFKNLKQEIL
jgi:hypothetical protein